MGSHRTSSISAGHRDRIQPSICTPSHTSTSYIAFQPSNVKIQTLKNSSDIYETIKAIGDERFAPRSTRLVLKKAATAVAMMKTTVAQPQVENQRLKRQLEQLAGPPTKLRVAVDPNEWFFLMLVELR